MGEKSKLDELVTEKMVLIHAIFVVSVCTIFGVINCVSGNVPVGIGIVIAGVASFLPIVLLKKKIPITTRGIVLSHVQLGIILVMSVLKHELDAMFPLLLASMNIAAIYYSLKALYSHCIICGQGLCRCCGRGRNSREQEQPIRRKHRRACSELH